MAHVHYHGFWCLQHLASTLTFLFQNISITIVSPMVISIIFIQEMYALQAARVSIYLFKILKIDTFAKRRFQRYVLRKEIWRNWRKRKSWTQYFFTKFRKRNWHRNRNRDIYCWFLWIDNKTRKFQNPITNWHSKWKNEKFLLSARMLPYIGLLFGVLSIVFSGIPVICHHGIPWLFINFIIYVTCYANRLESYTNMTNWWKKKRVNAVWPGVQCT